LDSIVFNSVNAKEYKDVNFMDVEEDDAHIIASPLVPLGLKSLTTHTCFKVSLLIRNTDIADSRDYTLKVQNAEGVAEAVVSLQVSLLQNLHANFYLTLLLLGHF